ncbi:hypothetical protein ACFONN_07090 [Dyella humi]|uniref:Uncharacterized protein n=1 Tax=Dyella humi TaxID=1770547 RepID=A0ABW8II66_9GAMM
MDMNDLLSEVVIGIVPFLFVLWMVYEWVIRPRKSLFKADGCYIYLDKANGLVHLECRDELVSHTVKLGCGLFSFHRRKFTETKQKWRSGTLDRVTIYHTGDGFSSGDISRGREGYWETVIKERSLGTSVSIQEIDPLLYYYQQWATNHSLQQMKTERAVTILQMTDRGANAFKRWVHAHRHILSPNEKLVRQQWDNSCKRLLKECRQDILVKQLKNPLELFDYTPAPNIRYLVLGKTGEGFFKSLGSHDMHAISLDQLRGDGTTLTVMFPNGWMEKFSLSSEHIARLHEIRRRWAKSQPFTAQMASHKG